MPDKLKSLNVLPSNSKVDELRREPMPASDVKKLNDETPIDRALDGSLTDKQKAIKERIIDQLRQVYDPELPVNLFDLGLIYRIDLETRDAGEHADIDMTLTAPACPVAGEMPGMVERAVLKADGVASAEVKLVWSPKWDKSRMSEAALLELGFL